MKQENQKLKVQVWVYLKHRDKGSYSFLILKTGPERGSFWQPVTGGVEPGETLEAAAAREAMEETGLVFLGFPEAIEGQFEFESRHKDGGSSKGQRVVEYGFSFEAKPDEKSFPSVQLDPHEHTEYKWVTAEEALQTIRFASNAQVLKSLLNRL